MVVIKHGERGGRMKDNFFLISIICLVKIEEQLSCAKTVACSDLCLAPHASQIKLEGLPFEC